LVFIVGVGCIAPFLAFAVAQQAAHSRPAQANAAQNECHSIAVKVYEKVANSETKVLANPTLTVALNKRFVTQSGGEVIGTEPALFFGTRVSGMVSGIEGGNFAAALEISVGNVIPAEDPKIKAVKSQVIALRMKLSPNETKSVRMDEKTWCDIAIQ
jgi:hypothetical protein